MGIPIQWKNSWETYLTALTEAHVHINDDLDELVWMLAEHGKYTPKLGYTHLLLDRKPEHSKEWWQQIWKLKTPPQARLFMWSVLSNKTPTREALLHRSIHGPIWCVLCKQDSKTNEHLFLLCPTVTQFWKTTTQHLSI